VVYVNGAQKFKGTNFPNVLTTTTAPSRWVSTGGMFHSKARWMSCISTNLPSQQKRWQHWHERRHKTSKEVQCKTCRVVVFLLSGRCTYSRTPTRDDRTLCDLIGDFTVNLPLLLAEPPAVVTLILPLRAPDGIVAVMV
jgi:hypothetical protein